MNSDSSKASFIGFHASSISQLIHGLGFTKALIFYLLPIYYLLTVVNAVIEGIGMLLLVSIFTGFSAGAGNSSIPNYVVQIVDTVGGTVEFPKVVFFLVAVLGINLIVRSSLLVFDAVLNAKLRRRLQETVFRRFLLGRWSHMRSFRVGDAVGTNTQEAATVAKYLSSAVSAVYFVLSSAVMLVMAIATSLQITLFLGLIVLPFVALMQKTFSIQASLSKKAALLRNNFSADITDRFNGLLQVHVDNNYAYHIDQGIRSQERLIRLDVLTGFCQAVIGSFNLLLPFFAMVGFSIWLYFAGRDYNPNLALIASVGILGLKAASQLNGAIASLGNLSRLSGSLYPVLSALNTPPFHATELIPESVTSVRCNNLGYSYGNHKVIDGATFSAVKGEPLLLSGRSGKGKTTITNLIAGLYLPDSGSVIYRGASGKEYPSDQYRARIGFVTQDIYLFGGSLRSNLVAGRDYTDEEIWSVLDQVEASDFVRRLGGLDTDTAEAGRSLSGGQRRRLGIARVLLSGCDILIFDEVTSGLDKVNKDAVTALIERLSRTKVVVIISHEEIQLPQKIVFHV